ncbi:hypothetical protein ACIQJX_34915 [Streptomyces griseoviridis]
MTDRLQVHVDLGADRCRAEEWLLSSLPAEAHRAARLDWERTGVAILPLGVLFSAVRLPDAIVGAFTGDQWDPQGQAAWLAEALEGGPVIADPRYHRWYALVPASVPTTWRDAVTDWRDQDVEVLGRGFHLGVPPLTATAYVSAGRSFWASPMSSAGVLCAPLTVARVIAAGIHAMGGDECL